MNKYTAGAVAVFVIVLFVGVMELGRAAFTAGCMRYGGDYQHALKCKKLAHASTWGFRKDVHWGDEVWRWDGDLNIYMPDHLQIDKTKYHQ